jgi:CBS domain-containing protein
MVDKPDDGSIRSLIRRPAVLVHLDDSLRVLAATLTEESIGAAVVRGTDPLALVSERDVVRALAEGADPDDVPVSEIMTEDVEVAAPTDLVYDVIGRMLENEIRHLPVVEDGAVVGMVSARDALGALAEAWYGHRP